MRDLPFCQSIIQTSLFCTNLLTLVSGQWSQSSQYTDSDMQVLSVVLLLLMGGVVTNVGLSVLPSLPPEVSHQQSRDHLQILEGVRDHRESSV